MRVRERFAIVTLMSQATQQSKGQTMTTKTHLYGEVTIGATSVHIEASAYELEDWATRPGHAWPCSTLRELDSIAADFDSNGLYDISTSEADDVDGTEFSAWASDVLADVLAEDHPCWFVTVGQFRDTDELLED